jgi:hypothetical protein
MIRELQMPPHRATGTEGRTGRGRIRQRLAAAMLLLPGLSAPALANDWMFTPEPLDEAVFVLGGRMMADVYNPFGGYEDNYFLGGGYQRLWGDPNGFRYGGEVGLTGRIGAENSLEAWGGVVGRYDWEVFGLFRAGLSMTFGLSAVTGTQVGRERESEAFHQGDASLLFYMGPELNLSLIDHPETEFFVRLHHRSGAWETLGGMAAGADASVAGVRWHF